MSSSLILIVAAVLGAPLFAVIAAGALLGFHSADIEPTMVRYMIERARGEELTNLYPILAAPNDPLVPAKVDHVLIVDTYHHISDRVAYMKRLRDYLAPGAKVTIVDFKKGDLPVGPPDRMKLSPKEVQDEMGAAGFSLAKHHTFLPHQYVLVFSAAEG